MERKGPRRESVGAKPGSIEYMQNQIDAESKQGLLLPKNIETNSDEKIPFPEFSQFLEGKKPQDVILYSAKTDLLRHLLTDKKKNGDISYIYQGNFYLLSLEYKNSSGQTHITGVKTIPPYEEHGELDTGPFRRMEYIENISEEAIALKEMKEKIIEAGNTGIPLKEDLKEGDILLKFKLAIEGNLDPEKIALYSIATGILLHTETQQIAEGITYYYYTNKKNPRINLNISLNKNLDQACVIYLSLATEKSIQSLNKERE